MPNIKRLPARQKQNHVPKRARAEKRKNAVVKTRFRSLFETGGNHAARFFWLWP